MRFNNVKIEKLFGHPQTIEPNQFYLVESKGVTRMYLSDTNGVLHLLNDSPSVISTTLTNIVLTAADNGLIITDKPSFGYRNVTLPPAEEGLYFEFWIYYGNGLNIYSSDNILISSINTTYLESNSVSSTVKVYAHNNAWVSRYITGQWDSAPDNSVLFSGDFVLFNGDFVTFNG